MEQNKKFKLLIVAGILGVLYSSFLLYKRRGGYLNTVDLISILIVVIFVGILLFFLKKISNKSKR